MKIKTRLLFAALLFAIGPMPTWAQTNAVVVTQIDGQVAIFGFAEKPVVTYSGSNLVLTTSQGVVEYPIYMLKKLAFDEVQKVVTAVEDVKQTDAQFRFQDGMISVVGGESGSQVFLYSMSGTKVGQYRLDGSGHIDIPVQHLSKGIYIIRTKHFTFKFRKS